MATPFPNMNITFEADSYSVTTLNPESGSVQDFASLKQVTNYEYEVQKNEEKRQILILKPEYLGTVIQDMKNIMRYDKKSNQVIDDRTKRVSNPKLKGGI
ncbi:MAG: hypothetical protein ABFC34_03515 [Methanobacterium sp.]